MDRGRAQLLYLRPWWPPSSLLLFPALECNGWSLAPLPLTLTASSAHLLHPAFAFIPPQAFAKVQKTKAALPARA